MELYDIIDQNKDGLIRDLQGCIQIPSLQADDSSGYPYGEYNRQWICGGRWQTEIPVCAVEGCTAAGRHLHDSILYCGYAHDGGFCNGACCELCPVEGCAFAGRHLHDGMVYCGASHTAGFCGGDCAVYHHGY